MKVVFRVDASNWMGTGHLMRCLTLAEALRERRAETHFICREQPGHLIEFLKQKAMPVTVLPAPEQMLEADRENYANWLGVPPAKDAEQTIKALSGDYTDWLIVDHYGIDVQWEQQLRSHVNKLMAIDDLANRTHACDLLLDQNYSEAGKARYASLVPESCQLLLGPRYTLLRTEFQIARQSTLPRTGDLQKILVFLTAGDDQGETLKVLQGIALYGKRLDVDVVVGNANTQKQEIANYCDRYNWHYHCQINYMASLISQADLVIGAGGSASWERCVLGAPALVTILAENQAQIAQALANYGAVRCVGWCHTLTAEDYRTALADLTKESLTVMSKQAWSMVDPLGTERVASELISRVSNIEALPV